jgi:hypothetical protein
MILLKPRIVWTSKIYCPKHLQEKDSSVSFENFSVSTFPKKNKPSPNFNPRNGRKVSRERPSVVDVCIQPWVHAEVQKKYTPVQTEREREEKFTDDSLQKSSQNSH